MAAKSDEEESKTTGKTEIKTYEPETTSHPNHNVMILGAVVVVAFLLIVGIGIGSWRHNGTVGFRVTRSAGVGQVNISPAGRFGGRGLNQGPVNSSSQVNGTVTAVNGDSFTVASYGSSTTVQTNSSTQYQDGNTVKVNDTVTAFGTTDNGTLTATLVEINP